MSLTLSILHGLKLNMNVACSGKTTVIWAPLPCHIYKEIYDWVKESKQLKITAYCSKTDDIYPETSLKS